MSEKILVALEVNHNKEECPEMMSKKTMKNCFAPTRLSLPVAVALAALGSAPAWAFSIETDNLDLKLNWDNTVRYNAGWRMEKIDPHFANSYGYDESETKFKRGDMVTNRLDLLSEFDVVYQGNYGFRVSAAAWSENAYGNTSKTNPDFNPVLGPAAPVSNYGPGGSYNRNTKRYLTGSSGEFLDAFVFGTFQLGGTQLNLKAGQHNVYWGEAMFTVANSIANSQGPIDTIKAATSPGAEAKELFMPLKQISAQWQLTEKMSLNAQYLLDWKPFRLVPGGTYFTSADATMAVCANTYPGGLCLPWVNNVTPSRKGGDWGLALHMSPEFLDGGNVGFYYRRYDEKLPWSITQFSPAYFGSGSPSDLGVLFNYARKTELFGFSISRSIATVSVAAELSYRHNTALNSVGGFAAGSGENAGVAGGLSVLPLTVTPNYSAVEGARGDTYHAMVNAIYLLPKTALWTGGTLIGELSYTHLDKVTKNANLFYSKDYACKTGYVMGGIAAGQYGKSDGCATKDAWSLNLSFTPEWPQALPGWDLKMPAYLGLGLRGNGATLAGTYEGAYNWSLGLTGTYRKLYEFGLAYNDSYTKHKSFDGGLGAGVGTTAPSSNTEGGLQNSHGWLSFRFKTSF